MTIRTAPLDIPQSVQLRLAHISYTELYALPAGEGWQVEAWGSLKRLTQAVADAGFEVTGGVDDEMDGHKYSYVGFREKE